MGQERVEVEGEAFEAGFVLDLFKQRQVRAGFLLGLLAGHYVVQLGEEGPLLISQPHPFPELFHSVDTILSILTCFISNSRRFF